jgi:SAM-dependent methyltransferase
MTESLASFIQFWRAEEQQPFTGWDFSYLDGRMLEDQAPWSYTARAMTLLRQSTAVIDLDTGGGERFMKMQAAWPEKVVATEHYPPNVALARHRLEPLGVRVVDVPSTDTHPLPFDEGEFDLVLNRHGGFNSGEVARILAPGGVFLTQQVHGLWAEDLIAAFDSHPQWPDATPDKYLPRLEAAGLRILDVQEWRGNLAFTDVGAIVYYLKAVPWLVPGFTVATHLEYLLALQHRLEAGACLVFSARKYLIEARKLSTLRGYHR